MRRIRWDIETNGLYKEVSRVHVLVIQEKGLPPQVFRNDRMRDGIKLLVDLSHNVDSVLLVGHNILNYDIEVLRKLYPLEMLYFNDIVAHDTLVTSRLYQPDMKDDDLKRWKRGKFPGQLIGRHSLEAWGHRLKCHKGDFKGPWDVWTQEMEDYCIQDVVLTGILDDYLQTLVQPYSVALEIEHGVQKIIGRQERRGFCFDQQAAGVLLATLVGERARLIAVLQRLYPPMWVPVERHTAKRKVTYRKGVLAPIYIDEGAVWTKVVLQEFNPGSRDHIAARFKKQGWVPSEYGKDGKPTVDEDTLRSLKYTGVAEIIEFLTVDKRLGQLSEGKEAWLRHVVETPTGPTIFGEVITNGAVTSRMSHMRPNIAQTPKVGSPYGTECRGLFKARDGYVLVGCDAAGLELRALAGYLALFDKGSYVQVVLNTDDPEVKARGDDMHSVTTRAIGLDPKGLYFGEVKGRDIAKTWFYAYIFGAGDGKLGSIILRLPVGDSRCRVRGAATRALFETQLSAVGKLVNALKKRCKDRGFILGLDGRPLWVRGQHAILNTLLQSAGAIIMKKALIILDQALQKVHNLRPGEDYEFVANVHDEWQIEVRPQFADIVGRAAVDAIRESGRSFDFRCPLDGEYKVGRTWADTH